MLTVQPKFTNYTAPKAISFKSNDEDYVGGAKGEEYYKEKVDFYKKQAAEFERMSEDSTNPDSLKKMMKGFRVASEALLEGWAVAWGASKGSKILKASVISGSKTKFIKGVKNILRPIYKGMKSSGKKITETYTKTAERIKTSKFAEKFNNFVEGMRKNPVGKYIVKGFEYVVKAFKYVGKMIKAGAKKLIEPLKGKTKSEIYDKTTKVASNTLGVGAGVAGAYNAATGADKRQADATNKADKNNHLDLNDDIDEDLYDEVDE